MLKAKENRPGYCKENFIDVYLRGFRLGGLSRKLLN